MKRLDKLSNKAKIKSSLSSLTLHGKNTVAATNSNLSFRSSVRAKRLMGTAMVSLMALATMVVTAPKLRALPTGGQVVAGSGAATITTNGSVTQINQTSNRAVIEWRSFDVGSNETVNFKLPNASGATLNRITGPGISTISGTVTSNGSLFFVNPNGLVFDVGSRVSVNSFVASTADISNSNFMAGQSVANSAALDFNRASSVNSAIIKLQGTITAASFGQVAVFGPQLAVSNTSTINASRGSVFLGNFKTAKLSWQNRSIAGLASSAVTGFYGVTQTNIQNPAVPAAVVPAVPGRAAVVPATPVPAATAPAAPAPSLSFVEQNGTINADGGLVTLVVGANNGSQIPTLTNSGTIHAPDLLINGILYSGSASLSAVDGSVSLLGSAVTAGGGGLLVNGATVAIANSSLKVETLATLNNGFISSKNATITISGKTVTLSNNSLTADSTISDQSGTTTRIKSGEALITVLADSLTLDSNRLTSNSQIDSGSVKLNSLVTGSSHISLKAKNLTSVYNRFQSTSNITVNDAKRVNLFSKITVETGNSSVAYVSDVFTYNSNHYETNVAASLVSDDTTQISGARLGSATTQLNLSALYEEPAVVPPSNDSTDDQTTETGPRSSEVKTPQANLATNGLASINWQNNQNSLAPNHTIVTVVGNIASKSIVQPNQNLAGTSTKKANLPSPAPVNNFTTMVIQKGLVVNSPTLLNSFQNQALVIDSAANSAKSIQAIKQSGSLTAAKNSLTGSDSDEDNEDLLLQNRLADAYARHFGKSRSRGLPFTDPDKAQPGLGFGGTDGAYGHEAPNPSVNLDFGRGLNQSFAVDEIKVIVPPKTLPAVKLQEIILQAPRDRAPAAAQPELKPVSLPSTPRTVPWTSGLMMQEIKFTVPQPAVQPRLAPVFNRNEVYLTPRFNRIKVAG